jgi:antitoxin MazE
MKSMMIKIGNSQGMRFPKSVIEQCGFESELDLSVRGETLMVRAKRKPREGWAEAFDKADMSGEDEAIWPDHMENEFDRAEWKW